MDENKLLFHGEMQLTAWGESSTAGAWVKMWVHPEDLESFKLMKARVGKQAGQRLGVAIVQIGDDEAVVQHTPAAAPVASPAPRPYRKPVVGDLARVAVIWCKSPVFQAWAADREGVTTYDEGQCKDFILDACGVYEKYGPQAASRKHLDTDPECGRLFDERIRIPFRDHLQQEGLEP